jgi:hypothetical protein
MQQIIEGLELEVDQTIVMVEMSTNKRLEDRVQRLEKLRRLDDSTLFCKVRLYVTLFVLRSSPKKRTS